MKKYLKKAIPVQAIQLNFELLNQCLKYIAWGGEQTAKQGDWLVKNGTEVYTVDVESFSLTYKEVYPGFYQKVSPVWAYKAIDKGSIKTKEGLSKYDIGDFLVFNNENATDGYTMSAEKFDELYTEA